MRRGILAILLASCFVGPSLAGNEAETSLFVDVPAQPLASALTELARTRHLQIIYHSEVVGNRRTAGAVGKFTAKQELQQLLIGTGLTYQYLNPDTVTVLPQAPTGGAASGSHPAPAATRSTAAGDTGKEEGKNGSSGPFRVAPADRAADAADPSLTSVARNSRHEQSTVLNEVMVTAEKYREPLRDVPVPDTVLDTGALADNGQFRLEDYFATVPGLSFQSSGDGFQSVSIRGINTGDYGNPTVGIVIDDVPFGSSQSLGLGSLTIPDIDPSDLERIEVLSGPQGTLYGADSIGGLIKFVTRDPSFAGLSGNVQVLGDAVDHARGPGYGVSGAINIPVSDTLALRASAFTRRDPGYVDDITTGQRGVNQVDVSGGVLSALWRPSASVSLKLGALLQNTEARGSATVDANSSAVPLSGLRQSGLPGNGRHDLSVRLYTARLQARLGRLDFTSITGYGINRNFSVTDNSEYYGSFAQTYFGVPATLASEAVETRKFSQEFRLSSPRDRTLEWLVGAFYTHERTPVDESVQAFDPATGMQPGEVIDFYFPSSFAEYALFGDVTVHFTRRFDVQFGGRESENRQTFHETDTGPVVPLFDGVPSPYIQPTEHIRGNAFTYLVTPRFRLSANRMVYMRFASGYRAGGPNEEAALFGLPLGYSPDRAYDYELGTKDEFFDQKLSLNASIYCIVWQQLQTQVTLPPDYSVATINAGAARSQGVEVEIQAHPASGLTVSANTSVNQAELTQSFPPTSLGYGKQGDQLPYSIPFSAHLAAEQDVGRFKDATGFVGASVSYVGLRKGEFSPSPDQPRLSLPAYAALNIHAGIRSGSWTVNLFVNNLTDTRGVLFGGTQGAFGSPGYFATLIQPRTVGVSVKTFF